MRRSNCSAPIPPRHPRGHHFFCCCPGVLITLIFTCPALYSYQNHTFFECPALFYHTHIFSDPGAARGDGGWTIWPAHKVDIRTQGDLWFVTQQRGGKTETFRYIWGSGIENGQLRDFQTVPQVNLTTRGPLYILAFHYLQARSQGGREGHVPLSNLNKSLDCSPPKNKET